MNSTGWKDQQDRAVLRSDGGSAGGRGAAVDGVSDWSKLWENDYLVREHNDNNDRMITLSN